MLKLHKEPFEADQGKARRLPEEAFFVISATFTTFSVNSGRNLKVILFNVIRFLAQFY